MLRDAKVTKPGVEKMKDVQKTIFRVDKSRSIAGVFMSLALLLLHASGQREVFLIKEGKKYWIPDPETFVARGFRMEDIKYVSLKELNQYPTGSTLESIKTGGMPPPPDIYLTPMQMRSYRIIFGFIPGIDQPSYSEVKDAGFNIIHTYQTLHLDLRSFLDDCVKYGLKAVITVPYEEPILGDYVNKWKDHPGLFGWYTFDEPDLRHQSKAFQETVYNSIKKYDKEHPVMIAYGDGDWGNYFTEDAFDILMVVAYPYWRNIDSSTCMRNTAKRIKKFKTRDYPVVPVMQAFYGENYINPSRHMKNHYFFWRERLGGENYAFYCWGIGDPRYTGVAEDPEIYAEVKSINQEIRKRVEQQTLP
ncbi:MAG: hypothetical protein ACE5K3_05540 [bacterium]